MNLLMLVLGILVIMAPGFLASLSVFPRPEDLDFWKRAGVSFGLGVLVLVYLGFILAGRGLLVPRPFFASLLISCGVLGFLALVRGGFGVVSHYLHYLRPRPKPVLLTCPQCGATFREARELELHLKAHKPPPAKPAAPVPPPPKPPPPVPAPSRFTCPRCGTVLETKEGLQAHLAVCRVKTCPYCGHTNPSDAQKCSKCGAWLFA
jgi:uncharacterized C2H2 Zn-finger protein